jgi:hypothetical protein
VVRAGQLVRSHCGVVQGETQMRTSVLDRKDTLARPDHEHQRLIRLDGNHGAAAAEGVVDWPEIEYVCSRSFWHRSSHHVPR